MCCVRRILFTYDFYYLTTWPTSTKLGTNHSTVKCYCFCSHEEPDQSRDQDHEAVSDLDIKSQSFK